jgi:hypothetical protein
MPWKLDLPWNELDHGSIEIDTVHVHPEQPLLQGSACFFGCEREQVVMVKDSHLPKYYSAARSRGKKHLASTPSSLLAFSHSFDVVQLASLLGTAVGTAVALDEIASGDQGQGQKGRSLLCLVPSLRGSMLRDWVRYQFISRRYAYIHIAVAFFRSIRYYSDVFKGKFPQNGLGPPTSRQ